MDFGYRLNLFDTLRRCYKKRRHFKHSLYGLLKLNRFYSQTLSQMAELQIKNFHWQSVHLNEPGRSVLAAMPVALASLSWGYCWGIHRLL